MTRFRKISCLVVIGLCVGMAPNSYASKNKIPPELIKLANKQLGKDFRILFTLKNAQICGGSGDAYIGQVEMNKPTKFIDKNDKVQLKDNWVKIDKSYSIFVDELKQGQSQLFDNDNCLE